MGRCVFQKIGFWKVFAVVEQTSIMLEELFGNSAIIKTIDFLLENRFWDYTKGDIADKSGISRTQLYRFWETLEGFGIVVETRRIGATTLYKANLESPVMKRLEALSLEVASEKNEKIIKEELEAP
jgi:hypothetical protein